MKESRMRIIFLLAIASAVLPGIAHAGLRSETAETKLAKMIAGRTAEKPVDCIRQIDIRSVRIIGGTALVYEGTNGTLYVNRPMSRAAILRDGLTLVTDTHSDQLCDLDSVRLMDMPSHMNAGSIGLGKFTPYPRPRKKR